jgi:CheY-like chemotaxis protein
MTDHAVVLIVEDDLDLATALQQILGRCGFQTTLAANGVEALDAVAARMPSVILLDMRMPIMDGWEFAREFSLRHGRAAPIIVMTAAENARERAAEIGAADVVPKPFEVKHLIAAIRRLTAQPACSPP